MATILLTGRSGLIAAHVLETLLQRGHSVVTTMRLTQEGRLIIDAHLYHSPETLEYAVIEDIAQADALDRAVISELPFEAVENKKELLEPAINGTVGLLESIYKHATSVKRVVITSSSAEILGQRQPNKVYTEADWCPVTGEYALVGPANNYRASKTFAIGDERAAWKFVEEKDPGFSLTCNSPLVLGPILHCLESVSSLNTSNQRIRDIMRRASKQGLPITGNHLFVDPDAANKRFFMVGGHFSNKEITEIIAENLPALKKNLPSGGALMSGDYPAVGPYGFDNTRGKKLLGVTYRPLKESIVDSVNSLEPFYEQ
ncbi:hypothetical protein F5B21DRAFT_517257 [Xylaria acuta]|nr:hypothetical protein F5B21DRAFT_517257 [Xylaria acuta]